MKSPSNALHQRSPWAEWQRWGREHWRDLLWTPSLVIAALLMTTYAVDIPTIDQWDGELPFLRKAFAGEAGFSDLIAPLCEHRLMLTRVLGLGVACVAGWNPRVALYNTLLCGAALVISLGLLNRRTCKPTGWRLALPNLLGGALVLGVPQYDTWLNPMHVSWYIVELLLAVSLLVACSRLSLTRKVVICIALAATATFSCANGLLLWFVVLPVLLVRDHGGGGVPPRIAVLVTSWAVAAALAIGGYFWGWQKPEETPPLAADGNVLLFLRFFVANVGCPFAHGTAVDPVAMATMCGLLVIGISLACGFHVLRHWRDSVLVKATAPWLAIVAFGMATGLAISIGRSGFGIDTAIVVRSIHVHVLTMYALIVLVPMILDAWVESSRARTSSPPGCTTRPGVSAPAAMRSKDGALLLNAVLCTAVAMCHTLYCVYSLQKYEDERSRYLAAKTAVLFSRSFKDGQLLGNVWSYKTVRDIDASLDFMDARGFLRPKTFRTALVKDLLTPNAAGDVPCGAMDQASSPARDVLIFGGWAILPDRMRPADSVVLTWQSPGAEPTVFAIAPVGMPRPDVAEKLGRGDCRRSGWGRTLPKDAMPRHAAKIRAWAFDATAGRVYPLDGAVDWAP